MPTSRHLAYPNERSSAPSAPAVDHRRDAGFTLVEMVVALLIIAILMGLLVTQFRGSKQTTYFKSGIASALAYSDAIEAYMADNGQRVPIPGQPAWPGRKRGPVDALRLAPGTTNGAKRPYLRTIPEPVSNGLVAAFPPGAPGAAQVVIRMEAPGGANAGHYRLIVSTTKAPILTCVISNRALGVGDKPCT